MDTIDLFVTASALLVILSIVLQMGRECAVAVWQRTVASLDELDLLEGNTVPATTGFEALLIMFAAMLKRLGMLPVTLYCAYSRKVWRLTPEAQLAQLRLTLKNDILLAVASMISGYPERAGLLFHEALRERIKAAYGITNPSAHLIA